MTAGLPEFVLARFADEIALADRAEESGNDLSVSFLAEQVRAAVEVKRRIVEQMETDPMDDPRWKGYHLGWRHAQFRTLALFALPHADHPDYREEWRP